MRTVLAGVLTGLVVVVGMPAATAGNPDFGRVWRDDGVLRSGCHEYKYHYRVRPRAENWALETFLRDPRGETIAHNVLGYGADPKRGTDTFPICRQNTKPGEFKIRGKLTWYVTSSESKVRWVKPGYFRLRKAS